MSLYDSTVLAFLAFSIGYFLGVSSSKNRTP